MADLKLDRPPQSKETGQNQWLLMRENGLAQTHRMEVGAFSWTPNFILLGNHLEVNTEAANDLIKELQITNALEIQPYHPPKEESVKIVGSVSAKGEAIISGIAGGVKRPKKTALITADPESRKINLLINFSDIADYVEGNLKGGKNNPEFNKIYGSEVNKAITKGLKMVPLANFALQGLENPSVFATEVMLTALSIMPTLLTCVGLFGRLLVHGPEDPSQIVPLLMATVSVSELGFMGFNFASMLAKMVSGNKSESVRDVYAEYLEKGLDEKKYGRFFYPENVMKYFIVPMLNVMTSDKTFVRGN